MDAIDAVFAYHEATKHYPNRFARSLGYLDWANQPNPFRRFSGAPMHALPLLTEDITPPYDALFSGKTPAQALTRDTVAAFFEHSLAISAWKEYRGNRWALRCNPSSGNLHPTEGYAVLGPLEDVHDAPAVYHYAPKKHALERRADISLKAWQDLTATLPEGAFLVGISSIYWREAWKYGERAYRYCRHDVGHALGTLAVSAAALGWQMRWLDAPADAEVAALLGLSRTADFVAEETEHPDLLAAVLPEEPADDGNFLTIPPSAFDDALPSKWHGKANRLSPEHVPWTAIDDVAKATTKPRSEPQPPLKPVISSPNAPATEKSARNIILQRRSAQTMDGKSGIPRERFYQLLTRVMPNRDGPVWKAFGACPQVDLILFAHRVTGLPAGMYCLVRNQQHEEPLRTAMRKNFAWSKPETCPEDLPLFLLKAGDYQGLAGQLSCGQAIAADGAFAVAMLSAFEEPLRGIGPWYYRVLFWETGLIGQILYLEAEAAGLRGTGIGCYFDDLVHGVLGLKGFQFQCLYHFTIGGPIDDPRLTTLPPYGHR
ncbi:MAG: SagB/ThcOx family dehydrogenase [Candidatus Hydrogenedentes bacterium]|nr:SagB/ThcOx family dehydrogenase [Candidatus Hydrogenedentota bacterium]